MASLLDTKSEVPSRLGSPWSGLRALGCNGTGRAGAGGSTDYKAFPSLALSLAWEWQYLKSSKIICNSSLKTRNLHLKI